MDIKKMITTPAIVEVVQVEEDTMDEIAAWCGGTHIKSTTGDFININGSEVAYPGGYIAKYGPHEAYSFTKILLERRFLTLRTFADWTDNYVKPQIEENTDVGTDQAHQAQHSGYSEQAWGKGLSGHGASTDSDSGGGW